jgi:23S rRNA (adenine2503-C2)-methyltransferase
MVSIHDSAGLRRLARELRLDPARLAKVQARYCRSRSSADEALNPLPAPLRTDLEQKIQFQFLTPHSAHDSRADGATRILFRTASGQTIESVILRIATGRTTLCLSTQAGCAAACAFCATGQIGLQANLTADEILDQVAQCNRILALEGRSVRNLVFMGMGEPFHNEANLHTALEVLCSSQGFAFDQRRVLVSTVGIPPAMKRFAERFPRAGLALSLHSARQGIRGTIMPPARRHSLDDLRTALEEVTRLQDRPVMIEYLLFKELNDGNEDLVALKEFLAGLRVHVNLIPFNPVNGVSDLEPAAPEQQRHFARQLKEAGFKVTTRYSLGSDVAAACGQLAGANS